MSYRAFIRKSIVAGVVLASFSLSSQAADSYSFEVATGPKVEVVRVAAQWDWSQRWFQSNGNHIGGYWDLSLAQWRGTSYRGVAGDHQYITSIGITPVFRWQKDSKKGFYAEAGIGAHLFSETYNNDGERLSTKFQFGDHVGLGYVFDSSLDLSLRLQHFSNAGIKDPNDGVDLAVLRASYRF